MMVEYSYSGHGVTANIPVLGTGDSRFESGCPDKIHASNTHAVQERDSCRGGSAEQEIPQSGYSLPGNALYSVPKNSA